MKMKFSIFFIILLIIPLVFAADSEVIPEFSTITASVALAGGIVGYILFKRKKGEKK